MNPPDPRTRIHPFDRHWPTVRLWLLSGIVTSASLLYGLAHLAT